MKRNFVCESVYERKRENGLHGERQKLLERSVTVCVEERKCVRVRVSVS